MKPHIFVGKANLCMKCFKNASDPLHASTDSKNYDVDLTPTHTFTPALSTTLPQCPGHVCSKCDNDWSHDYACGRKSGTLGLCSACAQQNAAEINRPRHVEEIAQASLNGGKYLSGSDAAKLSLEHEEIVLNTVIRDVKTGELRGNWQELIAEHIRQKEELIERLRIQVSSATKARAKTEVQELNRLTPEEQEQYKRDAKKMKVFDPNKKKAEKAQPITGSKREKAIVSMLKLMGKSDNPYNRRLIEDMME